MPLLEEEGMDLGKENAIAIHASFHWKDFDEALCSLSRGIWSELC